MLLVSLSEVELTDWPIICNGSSIKSPSCDISEDTGLAGRASLNESHVLTWSVVLNDKA